jgi:hypothetical protein
MRLRRILDRYLLGEQRDIWRRIVSMCLCDSGDELDYNWQERRVLVVREVAVDGVKTSLEKVSRESWPVGASL